MSERERPGVLARRERAFVRRWLHRHSRADGPPAPLLVARLSVRYRGGLIMLATAGIISVTLLVWTYRPTRTPDEFTAATVAELVVFYAVLYVASLLVLRHIRRADRRIGAALPHRVARPAAVDLRTMLGGAFATAAVVNYGGALLVGGAGLLLAAGPADRTVAAVFLAGTIVLAGFGAAVLADVARRPAVAVDARSLADDDVLRREDALAAVAPFLAPLALVAGIRSTSGDALLLAYLAYAFASVAAGTLAWAFATYGSARLPAGSDTAGEPA